MKTLTRMVTLAAAISAISITRAEAGAAAHCMLSPRDAHWLSRAVGAWRIDTKKTGIHISRQVDVHIFSADCELVSSNALDTTRRVTWAPRQHSGPIRIGSFRADVGPISQAGTDGDQALFVMSTPSVWARAGITGAPYSLETLMTAVFTHEATHTVQNETYFKSFITLAEKLDLPQDWESDRIQKEFKDNAVFAADVERETNLLFAAMRAPDESEARDLARQALAIANARRAHWYVGRYLGLSKVEDIFLTMEGSAQWAAYAWLIDPHGGAVPRNSAFSGFLRRTNWWSRTEGVALIMAADRIGGPEWKRHAFGDGSRAGFELLEDALALSSHAATRRAASIASPV